MKSINLKRKDIIESIDQFPKNLEMVVSKASPQELDSPIREGAWTVRQSIHHLVDSHSHSYIRIKFALTELNPSVKPYEEKDWTQLIDALESPINLSLDALRGLHGRLAYLLRRISDIE